MSSGKRSPNWTRGRFAQLLPRRSAGAELAANRFRLDSRSPACFRLRQPGEVIGTLRTVPESSA